MWDFDKLSLSFLKLIFSKKALLTFILTNISYNIYLLFTEKFLEPIFESNVEKMKEKISVYDITVTTSLNARGRPLKSRSVKTVHSVLKLCGTLKKVDYIDRVFLYKYWIFFLILRPLVNSSEIPLRQIYVVCDRSSPKNWR